MASVRRCDLRVVLLCKGRGADASSYRPNRDESQWWSRRDALVRCASSFLFGPQGTGRKELIFLFDDDMARMDMTVDPENCFAVPTEQSILSSWTKSAQKLNETVQMDGMICRVIMEPTMSDENKTKKIRTADWTRFETPAFGIPSKTLFNRLF